MTISEQDAIGFTEALGKIVQGSVDMLRKAYDMGVHKAMGYKEFPEWVEAHYRYMSLPKEERKALAKELTDQGYTKRGTADILGVDEKTVRNDIAENSAESGDDDPYNAEFSADSDLEQSRKREESLRKQLQIAQTVVETPTKKYSTIVIDPPWDMKKIERKVAPNQVEFDYPTMNEDQLRAWGRKYVVPAMADDCHFFMWTTQKYLPMALRLFDDYGIKYVLTMVWHKNGGFQPFGLPQYNCEFAVYGRFGTPKFIDTKAFNTCFQAPRQEHSRKPDEFYDIVRRVTDGDRIDIFSREPRDGFDQLGNETEKFSEVA